MAKCIGNPTLWILDNNIIAYQFYSKYEFHKTGNYRRLSETLCEFEIKHSLPYNSLATTV